MKENSPALSGKKYIEAPKQPEPEKNDQSMPKNAEGELDELLELSEVKTKQAQEKFSTFKKTFEPLINGYFGTESVQFTMKEDGWFIDLEEIKVNADPKFFLERGYTMPEALFATFHEAEHFRDMAIDHEAYKKLIRRFKHEQAQDPAYGEALHDLYNCLDDVLVNKVAMSRWERGQKAKDSLYPKLFPEKDLRGVPGNPQPRHRQFVYGLLREAMLPNEKAAVDPEVRQAMDEWQGHRAQNTLDLLTAVDPRGNAQFTPADRFDLIAATAEPILKKLYRKDLKDRKQKPKKGGEKDKGKGQSGKSPFGDNPFKKAIPDPIDYGDVLDQIDKINDALSKKRDRDFEQVMGVSKEDFERYKRDYDVVKPFIQKLSQVFDKIIQRRISTRRVLRKPAKEGPLLDPRKLATGLAEIKAGHMEPTIFLDYREQEVIREQPDQIEFTLVCDGSGSMLDNLKQVKQRQIAVLITGAFAEFQHRIEKQKREGVPLSLKIMSEVRMFDAADHRVKPLSNKLSHRDRVLVNKTLRNFPGGGNNEPATFEAIGQEQFNQKRIKKLREGKIKKAILFLTDGETDTAAVQAEIRRLDKLAGNGKKKNPSLIIGAVGFDGGRSAETTYAPHGYYAETLDEIPQKVEGFIKNILEDI